MSATGALVHRGSLEEPETLACGLTQVDGIVHTAFDHDFSRFAQNAEMDRRAIEVMGQALKGSSRPLIVTSGMLGVAPGRLAHETDGPAGTSPRASETAAIKLVQEGINASVVRLPPSVHGPGDHGFLFALVEMARKKGFSGYVGDNQNRWPGVHRLDAATVFRLAIERLGKGGPFHAVAEEGVRFKAIAELIARRLQLPDKSIDAAQASEHFGWMGHFASMDAPASSRETQALLAWTPARPTLLADLDDDGYFRG